MTIELSKETESLIEKALASGQFSSAEHVVRYALHSTLSEQMQHDETYNEYLRGLLAEAQADKEAGRVYTIPHGELHSEIRRRREAQGATDDKSSD